MLHWIQNIENTIVPFKNVWIKTIAITITAKRMNTLLGISNYRRKDEEGSK